MTCLTIKALDTYMYACMHHFLASKNVRKLVCRGIRKKT